MVRSYEKFRVKKGEAWGLLFLAKTEKNTSGQGVNRETDKQTTEYKSANVKSIFSSLSGTLSDLNTVKGREKGVANFAKLQPGRARQKS